MRSCPEHRFGTFYYPFCFFVEMCYAVRMQELKATNRVELGSRVNALRKAGFLPGVLYGEKVPSQSVSVGYRDFEKAYKEAGESTLLKLDVSGKSYPVLIHAIAYDPMRGNPLHVDFYAVRMDRALKVKVPVAFLGESPAVKNDGGILVKVAYELEVEALPQDLPHGLQIDISTLVNFESRILVRDIQLPHGVKVLMDADEVVALVEPPRSEEELATLAVAPVTGEVAEVKTERETKQELKEKEKVAEGEGKEKE